MSVTVTLRAASGATTTRVLPDPVVTNPLPPLPPTGLKVLSVTATTVTLDWNDSTDLRVGDKYQIYVNDVWAQLESTTSQYVVTNLVGGQTYQLRVGAGKPGSYGDWTAAVPATTTGSGTAINRPTNPMMIAFADNYVPTTAIKNAWAQVGALIIVGRNNYNAQWVKDCAAGGATVLIYLHPHLMNPVGRYPSMLFNASQFGGAVPNWPGGPYVVDQWGNLGDFRVGSLLNSKLPGVLNLMVSENPHMSGFFFDGLGTRAYPGAGGFNWDSFPYKQEYRDGAIAQAQIARGIADAKNLMIIVNGFWIADSVGGSMGGGYPNRGSHGCSLVDGGMVEGLPPSDNGFHDLYSTLPTCQWGQGISRDANLPVPRGYMVFTNSTKAEMDQWVSIGCAAYAHYGDFTNMTMPWRTFTDFKLPNRKV